MYKNITIFRLEMTFKINRDLSLFSELCCLTCTIASVHIRVWLHDSETDGFSQISQVFVFYLLMEASGITSALWEISKELCFGDNQYGGGSVIV